MITLSTSSTGGPTKRDIHSADQGIGLGVGGMVIIILIIGGCWWFYRRYRRKHTAATAANFEGGTSITGNAITGVSELLTPQHALELGTVGNTPELDSPWATHEMDEMGESPRYTPREEEKKDRPRVSMELAELEGDVALRDGQGGHVGEGFVMTGDLGDLGEGK